MSDGRQSDAAFQICRGVVRLIALHGMAAATEVALANGRRADVMGLGGDGEIIVVEIKSCLEDFRSDAKWPEYRPFCDRLFFAVAPDFPREVLPEDAGLIIADRYGGEIVREAPVHKLPPARRKALTLQIARLSAFRLQSVIDPEARLEAWSRG
ncbi:MAG: DNA repair protein MmcB-related protein [Hyphomicrobiales bacterium]|nr:MAG: DNA repair protein MmcB-related protein [Hyphomicrobiales bacterium]